MAVRHAVLKGKDAQKIIHDLDEIDDMGKMSILWYIYNNKNKINFSL